MKLRVLVVDDNVDGAESLRAVLESLGCTTAVAFDGANGVALAEAFNPHLALIDLEMPRLNGCEVARHLRARDVQGFVILICITGRGRPEDRRMCIEAGFDDFFTKPMLPADVVAAVSAASVRFLHQGMQA